jgi:hypothetical protein
MLATVRPGRLFLSFAALSFVMVGNAIAEPAAEDVDAARLPIDQMTPHDVGSRYGQALGAVEICHGASTTAKVPKLNSLYTGADLESFKAQATKIYDAWIKLKQCTLVDPPSECKVIVEESCAAAIGEIGPDGSVLPGLVEAPH